MSWTLRKTFRFESAHRLPCHEGKCQRVHGHDWKLHVILWSDKLAESGPQAGMVMDFYNVKQVVQPLVDELDHHFLNERGIENPTSELVAKWFFDKLAPLLPALVAVVIDETDGASCEYRRP